MPAMISVKNIEMKGGFATELRATNLYSLTEQGKRVFNFLEQELKKFNDNITLYMSYKNTNYSLPCELTVYASAIAKKDIKDDLKKELKKYIPPIFLSHTVTVDLG